MGRYIDSLFLASATFSVMFTVLSFTGKDFRLVGLVAAISAFCAGIITNKLAGKTRKLRLKRRRKIAEKKAKALIYADEKSALSAIFRMLLKKYRLHSETFDQGCVIFKEGEKEIRYALIVFRKFKVSADDLLSAWREIRKKQMADKIIFAIPGKSDPDVKLMPVRLMNPDCQLIDKNRIRKLIRKYDIDVPQADLPKRASFTVRIKAYINRKRALRYLSCALLLAGNYIVFGRILYLVFASALAFVCIFSLFSANRYEFLSD